MFYFCLLITFNGLYFLSSLFLFFDNLFGKSTSDWGIIWYLKIQTYIFLYKPSTNMYEYDFLKNRGKLFDFVFFIIKIDFISAYYFCYILCFEFSLMKIYPGTKIQNTKSNLKKRKSRKNWENQTLSFNDLCKKTNANPWLGKGTFQIRGLHKHTSKMFLFLF